MLLADPPVNESGAASRDLEVGGWYVSADRIRRAWRRPDATPGGPDSRTRRHLPGDAARPRRGRAPGVLAGGDHLSRRGRGARDDQADGRPPGGPRVRR